MCAFGAPRQRMFRRHTARANRRSMTVSERRARAYTALSQPKWIG